MREQEAELNKRDVELGSLTIEAADARHSRASAEERLRRLQVWEHSARGCASNCLSLAPHATYIPKKIFDFRQGESARVPLWQETHDKLEEEHLSMLAKQNDSDSM